VNRNLQSIVQHPLFFKLCSTQGHLSLRDDLVNLIHILFHLHPANTCQPSHVEPLIRIYKGTLSSADRKVLSIFHLFEVQRRAPITSLLTRWSSSMDTTSSNSLEAIHSLDPIQVFRSCLMFPTWRKFENAAIAEDITDDAQLYDPIFIILLFACMLSEGPPTSAFGWVELFRTNIISLLIRSMSSKDGAIRDMALIQLSGLWKCLKVCPVLLVWTVILIMCNRLLTCKKILMSRIY
jgi:nucleolar pre-ribosomal-associated protein 1